MGLADSCRICEVTEADGAKLALPWGAEGFNPVERF